MKRYIKITTITYIVVMLVSAMMFMSFPQQAHALDTPREELCQGVGVVTNGGGAGCQLPTGSVNIPEIITFVINLLSVIIGIVAVVMLMYGGFKFITSRGDPNNTASAKNTIVYALIGLAIAVSSQIIVKYVLARLL